VFILCFIQLMLFAQLDEDIIYDQDSFQKDAYYIEAWEDSPIYINQFSAKELWETGVFSADEVQQIIISRSYKALNSEHDLAPLLYQKDKLNTLNKRLVFDLPMKSSVISENYLQTAKAKNNYYYQRLIMQNKQIRMALLMEKDPQDRQYPDLAKYSISYHVDKVMESLYLGAFSVSSGNSLVLGRSFFLGNNTLSKLRGVSLKQDLSRSEYNYMTGVASKLSVAKMNFVPFVAISPFNYKADSFGLIRTINKTGIHDDSFEIKSSIKTAGLVVEYQEKNYLLGLNLFYQDYQNKFSNSNIAQKPRTISQYSQFALDNLLLRYEYALSSNKSAYNIESAYQKGKSSLQLGYRNYAQYFPENYAGPYSMRADFRNEKGLYSRFNTSVQKMKFEIFIDNYLYDEPENNKAFSKRGFNHRLKIIYPLLPYYKLSLAANQRKGDVNYQNEMTMKSRKSFTVTNDIKEDKALSQQYKLHFINDKIYNEDRSKNSFVLSQKIRYNADKYTVSLSSSVFHANSHIMLQSRSLQGFFSSHSLKDDGFLFVLDSNAMIAKNWQIMGSLSVVYAETDAYKAAVSLNFKY